MNSAAVAALYDEPLDWRFKGVPGTWLGRTPSDVVSQRRNLFVSGVLGPVCVLRERALEHNLATMARWCAARGVDLAPHGKTHMSPQLCARQFDAGAWAVTAATISQVRTFRAFGVETVVLANELVDTAGLRWLSGALDDDPAFRLICWVDSVRGVEQMTAALAACGAGRAVDVCVEVGAPDARTGCRTDSELDAVARAAAASPQLRLVGVSGYEAALGHDVSADGAALITQYLAVMREAVERLIPHFETDEIIVTAGGSTHFDLVTEALTGWDGGGRVRTVLRSGAYLTHDHGLYRRTSPLTRDGAIGPALLPALHVWAQAVSVPEPGLALLTLGRRDVSFDQDYPVPQSIRRDQGWSPEGLDGCEVVKLSDQHAFLRLAPGAPVQVGDWIELGISHPCTTFDKWQLIPVLDDDDHVVDLIRTFF